MWVPMGKAALVLFCMACSKQLAVSEMQPRGFFRQNHEPKSIDHRAKLILTLKKLATHDVPLASVASLMFALQPSVAYTGVARQAHHLSLLRRRGSSVAMLSPPVPNEEIEAKARRYFSLGNRVRQQLGPTEAADLERELADNFEFVAPLVGPLDRKAIIAATTGLDLAEGLPDFDARYHDFRADPDDPHRIWCTMRVKATHTGVLNFGGVRAEPQVPPIVVESPPEAVSLRFDPETGKLRELTTGYPLDRRVGSTSGLGGLFGILEGLGRPLPALLTRPSGIILAPLLRPFGLALPTAEEDAARPRPVASVAEKLEDEKLLDLARQLIVNEFGIADESLLSDSFELCDPIHCPVGKGEFIASERLLRIAEGLPDIEWNFRDATVCPYDVNRVWFTASPRGTHTATLRLGDQEYAATGRQWTSPPVRFSFTFDGNGKCISMTRDYVMDRRMGNTDGLGGLYGLCAALRLPLPAPAWRLRTPTQIWSQVTGR